MCSTPIATSWPSHRTAPPTHQPPRRSPSRTRAAGARRCPAPARRSRRASRAAGRRRLHRLHVVAGGRGVQAGELGRRLGDVEPAYGVSAAHRGEGNSRALRLDLGQQVGGGQRPARRRRRDVGRQARGAHGLAADRVDEHVHLDAAGRLRAVEHREDLAPDPTADHVALVCLHRLEPPVDQPRDCSRRGGTGRQPRPAGWQQQGVVGRPGARVCGQAHGRWMSGNVNVGSRRAFHPNRSSPA